MKKTPARLADGREIIYFDESERTGPAPADRRDLAPFRLRPMMRYDVLLDEWVGIADFRQDRTFLPPADQCPLCPSTATRLTEIPAASYDVVVFENRFPAFAAVAGTEVSEDLELSEDGQLHPPPSGGGRCEVVCFTADHDSSFSALPADRVRTVIEAWADRTTALSALQQVEDVFCFENRGREIGVTLPHPHGQIYAYPFLAPRTQRMLDSARAYRKRTSRDLPALSDAERAELAWIYVDVLRRMENVFDDTLPYIAAWHQAPVRTDRDLARLHLRLFSIRRAPGKLKYLAGSESAMGAFVNDVRPEIAARLLREAVGLVETASLTR